jgi:hypothetical protein
MEKTKCCPCGKSFDKPSKLTWRSWETRRYCSAACQAVFHKPWLGKKRSEATKQRISETKKATGISGDLHWRWKDDADHSAIRKWRTRNVPKVGRCADCDAQGPTEWASLDVEPGRDETSSWIELCAACRRKRAEMPKGEEHHRWKGEKAGYGAIHMWALTHFVRPPACEHCGRTDALKYEWAQKAENPLSRQREDWLNLCVPCHIKYDGTHASVRTPKVSREHYRRAHWRRARVPKQGICFHCHTERKTAWANRTGLYLDDNSDWVELCYPCHKLYDLGKLHLSS